MMAPIKSVLFVDYDSLYMSLRARDPGMARRFALRPGVWIEAIEQGLLLESRGGEPARRRILMRRCYADPKLLGKARAAYTAQGFQIVDCPPLPGRERNSAEIHMVLDTVDALAHQTGFEEFILLSADSDLTPVIFRLRSYNRATSIYTTPITAAGYRAIADGVLDEQALMALLAPTADGEAPEASEDADEESAQGRGTGERDELAGLARRIHQATNVPLFSPRGYHELFHTLTREVAENGYHFQTTAENVAARLSANGRNASRRQIAFIVKGLALKGHVFSVSDSPGKLAEAFKEQVLYLARAAGIEIDESMEAMIRAWIVGRNVALPPAAPIALAGPPAPAAERPEARQAPIPAPPPIPVAAPAPREARPITLQPISAAMPPPARPIPVRPIAQPEATPAVAETPQPVAEPPQPAPVRQPAAVQPVNPPLTPAAPEPAPRAAPEARPAVEAPQPAAPPPRRAQIDPESLLADIRAEPPAARPNIAPPRARVARPEPAPTEPPARPIPAPTAATRIAAPRAGSAVALRPPARRSIGSAGTPSGDRDPIENSILAAIAQAVDVLVDDGDKKAPAAPQPSEPPAAAEAPQPAEPAADDDIGDEIQRILAAYSQNRKEPGR